MHSDWLLIPLHVVYIDSIQRTRCMLHHHCPCSAQNRRHLLNSFPAFFTRYASRFLPHLTLFLGIEWLPSFCWYQLASIPWIMTQYSQLKLVSNVRIFVPPLAIVVELARHSLFLSLASSSKSRHRTSLYDQVQPFCMHHPSRGPVKQRQVTKSVDKNRHAFWCQFAAMSLTVLPLPPTPLNNTWPILTTYKVWGPDVKLYESRVTMVTTSSSALFVVMAVIF